MCPTFVLKQFNVLSCSVSVSLYVRNKGVPLAKKASSIVLAEWIEGHSSAGAPLATYATNHQETYRDPVAAPPLPPPLGSKR